MIMYVILESGDSRIGFVYERLTGEMNRVRSKVISMIAFIILAFLLWPMPVYATNKASADKNVVRIGYYQNEVFEDGASEGAIKKGYAYEYYRKISEYTGWEYEYVYGDFVTIYNMLVNGEVDLVAGLANTEDRASIMLFPDRAMGWESYGIVKHEDDRSITSDRKTLTGRTIGVLDSAIVNVLQNFLDTEKINAKVVTFNDYETLLAAFDRNELDAIAAEIDGIYDRNHATVLYSIGDTEYFLGVNKMRADILNELNSAQNQLFSENPDYLSLLRSKYYASTLSSRAFTKAETDWIAKHDSVTVGYLEDFLPYSDTDKNGKATGIVADVIPKLFSELDLNSIKINYVGYDSYDEITEAIRDDQIDIAFPMGGGLFFSEEDGMYLTENVISAVTDLIFTDSYSGNINNQFAASKKNKLQYYNIMNNYSDADITMYEDIYECLDAVANGKAVCTTLNGLRTGILLKRREYSNLSFIQLPESEENCFGVKIGNDGLLKVLNRGLNIIDDDYAQSAALRYSQNLYSYSFYDFFEQYSAHVIIFLLILGTVIISFLVVNIIRSRKLADAREKARIEIEKANHEKFEFVNKMGNYMSEPMNNLVKLIEKAKSENDSPKLDGYLDKMGLYSKAVISEINNILNMSSFESGQLQLEDRNIVYNLQGKRVLIAEDSEHNELITSKIMKNFGFEVQTAAGKGQAYDKLNAAPAGYFDAVILNIENNKTDGFEVAKRIRNLNNPDKAMTPIIAIISDKEEKNSAEYREAMINDAVYKPFDLGQVSDVFINIFN